jgi:hypothetical protein
LLNEGLNRPRKTKAGVKENRPKESADALLDSHQSASRYVIVTYYSSCIALLAPILAMNVHFANDKVNMYYLQLEITRTHHEMKYNVQRA